VLVASSQQVLQRELWGHVLSNCSEIISEKTEVLNLSRNPGQRTRQVNGNTLHQVEKLKCLEVLATSEKSW